MPKVVEVTCLSENCDVDMFSIHYESYIPEDEYERDYACPGCGSEAGLEPL
jgi:hypothetical protein